MKIKSDYVTNSSSTSFILGTYNVSPKVKIEVEIDLEDYDHKKIKTLDELDKYYRDMYYEDIETNKDYIKCKEVIEKEGEILIITVEDYGEKEMESFLCRNGINNLKFSKGIVIIKGDGGY